MHLKRLQVTMSSALRTAFANPALWYQLEELAPSVRKESREVLDVDMALLTPPLLVRLANCLGDCVPHLTLRVFVTSPIVKILASYEAITELLKHAELRPRVGQSTWALANRALEPVLDTATAAQVIVALAQLLEAAEAGPALQVVESTEAA